MEPLDYSYSKTLTIRQPLAAMSISDKIRLLQDLLHELLLTDTLKKEEHLRVWNYVEEVTRLSLP